MKKLVALMVALTLVLGLAAVASAADYPTKGLIAINPWSAGGGTDNCLRAFCSALEKQLGVSVTVDNQTGASGVTGHEAIADADPDGYTIGMITFELATYKPSDMSDYTYENYDAICRINTDAAAVTVNAKWACRPTACIWRCGLPTTASPIWRPSLTTARLIRARSRWAALPPVPSGTSPAAT